MLGADTDSLRAQRDLLSRASGLLADLADSLPGHVAIVEWRGPDREAFENRLLGTSTRLRRVAENVRIASVDLDEHAEEQDDASSPDPAPGGSAMDALRDALRQAHGADVLDEALREMFGASGDATPGSLGGYEDPGSVHSRSLAIDESSLEEFDPRTVVQGDSFGDCWFLATLASVADRNPALIAENIELVQGETPEEDYWIVTSTPPGWLLGGAPDGDVVDGHVYVVEGFSTNDEGDEVIVLVNPWGKPDGSRPPVLELTQAEYLANFVSRNNLDHG